MKKMNWEKISVKVRFSHEFVAQTVAEDYCRNIMRDTDNTFGTLEGIVRVFGFEIGCKVRDRASRVYRVQNIKFRPDLFREQAAFIIRERLRTDSALSDKLRAIREAQKAKHQSEIRAEHATYAPLPVAN